MSEAPVSLWSDTAPPPTPRPPLPGDRDADVVIVGAGYTGLWTALTLLRRDPALRVVLLEAHHVGFGASGRNGGWASALLPMGLSTIAHEHGRDAAIRMQRAMHDAIGVIQATTRDEGIDCHFAHGGTVQVARSAPQESRLAAELDEHRSFGFGDTDLRWLDRDEADAVVRVTGTRAALVTPHCAAIHPALLVHGLAAAVERRGGVIHDNTAVTAIEAGVARTARGSVRAPFVVRATEAFTASLDGHRRDLAPVYSLMLATEPLPASFWGEVGWRNRETFADARRSVIYGQRTADDRIAFGGRGAPYHLGSHTEDRFDVDARVHALLHQTLRELFPAIGDAAITHRWGGPVGVPRDWRCSVGLDRASGLAWAGGYVGDGVTTTNLAGRTLAALVLGDDPEDLTTLAWVGHRSRRWEPEPLRWIGINTMVRLTGAVDRIEDRTDRPERWRSRLLDGLTGH